MAILIDHRHKHIHHICENDSFLVRFRNRSVVLTTQYPSIRKSWY
jgi:hypothetical protein